MRAGDIKLAETRWLVLDEADRMLDMGFIGDVRRLPRATHRARHTAMFSATMPREIEELAAGLLTDPVRIEVAPQGTAAAEIVQSVVLARTRQKRQVLARAAGGSGVDHRHRLCPHQARRGPRQPRSRP